MGLWLVRALVESLSLMHAGDFQSRHLLLLLTDVECSTQCYKSTSRKVRRHMSMLAIAEGQRKEDCRGGKHGDKKRRHDDVLD